MLKISDTLPPAVKEALQYKLITRDIYIGLSEKDRVILKQTLQKLYNEGDERQRAFVLAKSELINSEGYRKRIWNNNHFKITESIANYLEVKGKTPNPQVVAKLTGLSVKTVSNHLDSYAMDSAFIDKLGVYKASALKMADLLLQKANTGAIPAIKLFMQLFAPEELSTKIRPQTNVYSNTQNIINVEGNIFKKEDFEGLSEEQINKIKAITRNKTIQIDEHI